LTPNVAEDDALDLSGVLELLQGLDNLGLFNWVKVFLMVALVLFEPLVGQSLGGSDAFLRIHAQHFREEILSGG
jgi:hypothetical protein